MTRAFELAPRYVEASEATRPALGVMASTLYQAGLFADLIGHVLLFGIGMLAAYGWIVVIGVVLLRLRESVGSATGA